MVSLPAGIALLPTDNGGSKQTWVSAPVCNWRRETLENNTTSLSVWSLNLRLQGLGVFTGLLQFHSREMLPYFCWQ